MVKTVKDEAEFKAALEEAAKKGDLVRDFAFNMAIVVLGV